MQKKPGRPPKRGPKLVKVMASILPSLRDEVDQAVAANGTRSSWIADAIKTKLEKSKKRTRQPNT